MKPIHILAVGAMAVAATAAPAQQDAPETPDAITCIDMPEPVVSLDYGSRYTDESADRSDIDKESNQAVNEALGPIDGFISDLVAQANTAISGDDGAAEAAACVVDALAVWADADALSELESMNAQISSPSRLGGMALAYLQAKTAFAPDPDKAEVIESWLRERMRAAAAYFDDEAPPKASRNNLRAWAGLAATAAGEATGDDWLTSWGAHTAATVACQADEDGALPLEMERGNRALHYQLHAVAPLVVSAAFLDSEGYPTFSLCNEAIPRIVGFTIDALQDAELVTEKAGEPQTYFEGDDEVESFELAWAEAYLAIFDDPDLAAFVEDYRPLGHSKLGGSQSALW